MISAKCEHGQTPFTCLICQQDNQYILIIQENAKLKERIKELEAKLATVIPVAEAAVWHYQDSDGTCCCSICDAVKKPQDLKGDKS